MKISVVVNTYNEEKNLRRCLESVRQLADEIVVVDMHSTDETISIAKKFKANVFLHDYTRYVEPARNFALSKASGDYIFLIDADEELSPSLSSNLKKIAQDNQVDWIDLPRKNIIFGKWIKHSRWWPDYLTRFFRNGKVKFSDKIHVTPIKEGDGLMLEASEENALIHYNYQTISQYLERLNRYTDIQAEEIETVNVTDLLKKPANEFFSRFFEAEGYKDGIHGLALASLQAFSELVIYLKVWEKNGFVEKETRDINKTFLEIINDCLFWLGKQSSTSIAKLCLKIKSKL
ncbi:MAG: glycosyltransferase family 2 protein [Patescibacteria group bacterium]|nr:glycosyltransferase family 2 protein [Patescibacteria group bacterium]